MTVGLDTVRLSAASFQAFGEASPVGQPDARTGTHASRAAVATASSESASQLGDGRCRTCAERKYQDVSNDPTVSFQTPTSLDPGQAAGAVSAHERQHVRNNAEEAQQDGMTATSTVVLHTDMCPECGRIYVSGGTTTTTYTRTASPIDNSTGKGHFVDATA